MIEILRKAYRLVRYGNRMARLLRLANMAEIRWQRRRLLTHPPFLCLDPGPVCNLRCLSCPTGDGTSLLAKEFLEPDTFERIVKNIRLDRLVHVNLYRLGEPLLNRHLAEYIRFFADRGIFTSISVNFSAKDYDDDYLAALCRSGLDEMVVSVDGTTQETYEKYRIGGHLERVLGNLRRMAAVKRSMGLYKPHVVYKMLLNRFNQHQVDEARKLAASVDAEFYQPHFFWTPQGDEDTWTADEFRARYGDTPQTYLETDSRHRYVDTECRQLWNTLQVNANGDVFPCCFYVDPSVAVGNLLYDSAESIWNGDRMRCLRGYVVDREAPPPPFPNRCAGCSHRFCTYWNKERP
ncbi:MAG TPA: radical SAM protein [Candidatus Hydrogenedentes bacterium]|nr:radical SAM protein [Candidatus Hydrogenedentota bacterium]HOV75591.1 radical SAM protein [Candidatus Hydrogenedentota bacterium]HPC17318.1 radical SAM protein [Candidatus Hydrogenedentota bacterium]HRT20409.1 radical SAM protein [Candidatus Hydrogenedentota bacterium]HRT66368.1 radical SAM protein [Candidatus Hydrogenedentota bacterium]